MSLAYSIFYAYLFTPWICINIKVKYTPVHLLIRGSAGMTLKNFLPSPLFFFFFIYLYSLLRKVFPTSYLYQFDTTQFTFSLPPLLFPRKHSLRYYQKLSRPKRISSKTVPVYWKTYELKVIWYNYYNSSIISQGFGNFKTGVINRVQQRWWRSILYPSMEQQPFRIRCSGLVRIAVNVPQGDLAPLSNVM